MGIELPRERPHSVKASSYMNWKAKESWGSQPSKNLVCHNWLGSGDCSVKDSMVRWRSTLAGAGAW